jgi:RNA polymerase sigma-70 factor (ECF subfamily)
VLNNERLWITQAQQGNVEAFSQLVETYQKPVYNLCYRMLNNAGDAEDAAQETFMRAYKSMKRYDNARPFATWLLSIAAHYCIDNLRKRRMTIISMEEMPQLDLPDNGPTPEGLLGKKEEKNNIRELLDNIGVVDRAAVIMYYWYEYSYEEIAEVLSLSQSAVKSRLHRARREMAKRWIEKQPQTIQMERKQHESPAF